MSNIDSLSYAGFFPVDERVDVVSRPVVCVQGLGFVGAAMAIAVAAARNSEGEPVYNVIGVDLPSDNGRHAVSEINEGRFPAKSVDESLNEYATRARNDTRNLIATTDTRAYGLAKIVLIDINLDVDSALSLPVVDFSALEAAVDAIGRHIRPGALVIVETTVPPGTCEHVVGPRLRDCVGARGIDPGEILLAHSYERVMPGEGYLDSVRNFWRVYSGASQRSADECERFLSHVVNIDQYPLVRLPSTTSSETAKILENSYRAVNIALIEEWSEFASSIGVDLMGVVEAIRMRPTHSNIRQPGFGVGGYCLPKDPLLAGVAARQLFDRADLRFPFSELAVSVNKAMPMTALAHVERLAGGDLRGKRILLLGVTYRQGVEDTRYSPSASFVHAARAKGAAVNVHDPIVRYWHELDLHLSTALPSVENIDVVVLAVAHNEYADLDYPAWLGDQRPAIFDACRILDDSQRRALDRAGVAVRSIGSGAPP